MLASSSHSTIVFFRGSLATRKDYIRFTTNSHPSDFEPHDFWSQSSFYMYSSFKSNSIVLNLFDHFHMYVLKRQLKAFRLNLHKQKKKIPWSTNFPSNKVVLFGIWIGFSCSLMIIMIIRCCARLKVWSLAGVQKTELGLSTRKHLTRGQISPTVFLTKVWARLSK